jgi:hypothetical protein
MTWINSPAVGKHNIMQHVEKAGKPSGKAAASSVKLALAPCCGAIDLHT